MMRFVGAGLILLCAAWIGGGYRAHQMRGLAEAEGIADLLRFIKRELVCFARPIGAWSADFSNEALERVGFLPLLRQNVSVADGYRQTAERFSLCERGRELFFAFCGGFGGGYREETVAHTAYYADAFSELLEQEREGVARRCRLARTLCATGSLMLVILLL